MSAFLWNLLLAVIWVAWTEQFTSGNLMIGFGLGYLILALAQLVMGKAKGKERGKSNYVSKVRQVFGFALYFLWELVLANLRVAYDVVTPTHHMRPGVIAIPLDAQTDAEITTLANFITLTPGTLSLDVSEDRKVLYIHAMYIYDREALRREIKSGLERRILEVMR
ncbi:MAG: Na+/H+ antiporter subunit E [Acidobacteria bacterium]|nr:Na+/H+ antiporter subunit E [Acidobacteriota bacterium]